MPANRRTIGITAFLSITGRGAAFGVNLSLLKRLAGKGGTIRLDGKGAGDPLLVLTDDPDLLQVIMPMRLLA